MVWLGTFKSTRYSFLGWFYPVRGYLTVDLPADFSFSTVSAQIFYKGLYKYGKNTKFQFLCSHDVGCGTEYVNSKSSLWVKLLREGHKQNILFLVEEQTDSLIRGRYISKHPRDKGTFVLRRC
jgi:hypothetical protein